MRSPVRAPEPTTISYYHGTSALAAACISVDGFRLLPTSLRRWGEGALGKGIYITPEPVTSYFFAELGDLNGGQDSRWYVVRVRMSPGTRILRLDGNYDPRVINYLGREFGKNLFTPKFDRAIPANKHLSRVELISLANYLWIRGEDEKRGGIAAWSGLEAQGPLRRYLLKHKYDGMGCIETHIGVVVFNPSKLVADGIFQIAHPSRAAVDSHGAECLEESNPWHVATKAAEGICVVVKAVPKLRDDLASAASGSDTASARWLYAKRRQ